MAGKKPSRGTPKDMRLKRNKKAAAASSTGSAAAKPKFGSPAWDAKYGIRRFGKGGKKA